MFRKTLVVLGLFGAVTIASGSMSAAFAGSTPPAAAQMTADAIQDRIDHRLESSATLHKYSLHVKVASGVATLTGDVATAAQKAEAERLAKVDGITRVDNQIKIDPDEDKSVADRIKNGLNKTGEKITDAWITTKVKWFFVGEDALKDSDINVDTKDGVVTLKGTVKSSAGKARAEALARNTDGVKRVVDQLTIK
jgi:hyperosmotically inducible protein